MEAEYSVVVPDNIPPAIIIAAGRGSRLAERGAPKPLQELVGKSLLEHVMSRALAAGIKEFVVVTGYQGDRIEAEAATIADRYSAKLTCVLNSRWQESNGISVLQAKTAITGNFVLLMADHLFDPDTLKRLLTQKLTSTAAILAVDSKVKNNPMVDLDDVTKVMVLKERIIAIGKGLTEYNAFDTGMFYASPALFTALTESVAAGDASLSGGMRQLAGRGEAVAWSIGDAFWLDIDDAAGWQQAEGYLREKNMVIDGGNK